MLRRDFLATCATCSMLAFAPRALAQIPRLAPGKDVKFRGVYATILLDTANVYIRRLAAPYGSDRRLAISEVLGRPTAVLPAVLYALANTLVEDHAEQAIFWYHVGRVRAVYDALRCRDKTSQPAALLALRHLISKPLAEAQFYRRERLVDIARKAIDWDSSNSRSYDERWPALFGEVAQTSPGTNAAEVQLPEAEWPAILTHVHETHLVSVEKFAAQK